IVKPHRTVFVVINASHSPMLTIPDIIDNCSYREAQAKLLAMGFKLGETEFIYGEKDWLYGLKDHGKLLQNGQRVSVEDVIVMQVGNGLRNESDSVVYMDADNFVYEEPDEDDMRPIVRHSEEKSSDDFSTEEEDAFDDFQVVTEP
ncbi:MAG: penicillin-binding protein, partial [Prevotella sp.]|nr:penicillin-binding protein [Prevotella sp.]